MLFDLEDNTRENAAVMLVACPACHAPGGYHCASHSSTIVWPPHLCRMDAYTHRLDPSEDWPQTTASAIQLELRHVESKQPAKPLLWRTMVSQQLLKPHSITCEE